MHSFWWTCLLASVSLVESKCKPNDGYSETLRGFNTLGDHFGYPAFADAHYDYVVVGGGTAGLAMATRLAEGGAGTVAVIEAGGFYEQDNGNLSTVPGTAAYFIGTAPKFRNPQIDWEYRGQAEDVSHPYTHARTQFLSFLLHSSLLQFIYTHWEAC